MREGGREGLAVFQHKNNTIQRVENLGQYAFASVYYRKDDIYVQGFTGKHLSVIDLLMDDDQLSTEGLLQIQDEEGNPFS